jgi:hypothetical protein
VRDSPLAHENFANLAWSGLNARFSKQVGGVVEFLGNASFTHDRVGVHMIASTCIEGIAFIPVR